MSEGFLQIRKVRKSFDSVIAIEDVSLEVPRGEFLTFLGPSGSGKSTTLYVIAGFHEPSEGDVRIEGKSILSMPSHKRNIGMVFQQYTLFPHLSVGENVAFPLRVRRQPSARIDAKVEEMLALVRLDGLRDRRPGELSGGQQQRVALARALSYDPPLLLMDEPLSALDKKLREEMQYEIRRIHHETGVTILYVTHDQEEALRLSDRIALFNHGRIEQIGSGSCLYMNPSSEFVAGFIGNSNFLDAEIEGLEGGKAKVVFPDGTEVSGVRLCDKSTGVGKGVVVVRPENIRILPPGEPGSGIMQVRVRDMTFLGENTHLLAETAWGQEIKVRSPLVLDETRGLSIGDVAHIRWTAGESIVFPGRHCQSKSA
jgi:putative spermidine/putrescine transport system ATP-binding protein